MLSALYHYLSSLPPEHTVFLTVLAMLTPGYLIVLGGLAWCHAADVAAARKGEL